MASSGKKATIRTPIARTLVTSRALASVAACGFIFSACGSPDKPPPNVGVTNDAPQIGRAVSFSFDSLDERSVSSEAARGRIAVLAFVTTWDLSSQAEVDFIVAMAKHDGETVYYALISLDDKKNRELVEAYKKSLNVSFPVAMADADTIAGRGTFGPVNQLPSVVVLDREGRVLWQKSGISKPDEIRAHMK